MKRSYCLFLGLLLAFFLVLLPLPGQVEAGGVACLNMKIGYTSLQQGRQVSPADQLYDQIYRQIKQQVGSLYPERTIKQITDNLVKVLLPQLEKILTPAQDKPQPGPKPPVLKPGPWEPAPPTPLPDQPLPGEAEQPSETSFRLTRDEALMLELVNQERTKQGLKPLLMHPELTGLARLKAEDMLKHGYFSHISPAYGSPFQMMEEAGIRYSYAGENLAGSPTANQAHAALMNSPGHRANILNANFTHVGIGIVDGGNFGKIFVQMFIKPR
jgi:uncharacterized YkwD family protein